MRKDWPVNLRFHMRADTGVQVELTPLISAGIDSQREGFSRLRSLKKGRDSDSSSA